MKSLFPKLIASLLVLVAPMMGCTHFSAHSAPAEASSPLLPTNVFHALEAGEHQTVITYGTSVTIYGEWANELKAYFDAHYPGQVTFLNSAKAGRHSSWGLENLQEYVIDHHPDLLFVEFAINDAATKHGISTEQCGENLNTLIEKVRAENPNVEIVLQTMNPAWDSPKSAPKKYASDRPTLNDYYQVYRDYAAAHNLPLIDQYPSWKKIMDEEPARYQEMVPDGIHPNKAASVEVAWPNVKALLDRARVFAGATVTISIWPESKMPGTHTDDAETEHAPERTDAVRLTNVSNPTLSLYPSQTDAPAPAVIVCPGGAYKYCVADKEGTEVAQWLNSLGIHALVLKYRTPDNREGALQDIQGAIRLVRANAETWNIDPERVGCIGFSAGGNLCAKASNLFNEQRERPDFAMLIYPAYLDVDGKLAPELKPDADLPPTLIIHSEDDKTFVPGSKLYAAALKENNQPFRFHCFETGGHGYGLRCELEAKVWPDKANEWLQFIGVIGDSAELYHRGWIDLNKNGKKDIYKDATQRLMRAGDAPSNATANRPSSSPSLRFSRPKD